MTERPPKICEASSTVRIAASEQNSFAALALA